MRSWVSDGCNQPVEPPQLASALGERKVYKLARNSGLRRGALLSELARLLPTIIDRLTPHEKLPEETGPFEVRRAGQA